MLPSVLTIFNWLRPASIPKRGRFQSFLSSWICSQRLWNPRYMFEIQKSGPRCWKFQRQFHNLAPILSQKHRAPWMYATHSTWKKTLPAMRSICAENFKPVQKLCSQNTLHPFYESKIRAITWDKRSPGPLFTFKIRARRRSATFLSPRGNKI